MSVEQNEFGALQWPPYSPIQNPEGHRCDVLEWEVHSMCRMHCWQNLYQLIEWFILVTYTLRHSEIPSLHFTYSRSTQPEHWVATCCSTWEALLKSTSAMDSVGRHSAVISLPCPHTFSCRSSESNHWPFGPRHTSLIFRPWLPPFMQCYHVNVDQNQKGIFPTPCGISIMWDPITY